MSIEITIRMEGRVMHMLQPTLFEEPKAELLAGYHNRMNKSSIKQYIRQIIILWEEIPMRY